MSPAQKPAQMPEFSPAPEELKNIFDKAMLSMPMAEKRKMFSYPCAFINGQMFTGLFRTEMFVRLSSEDRLQLLELEGAKLFEPMPGRPMREYVTVPEPMLNQASELDDWLTKAFNYAGSLPPKTPKAKKPKKGPALK
jgi:TfoX/Sxy family transcriptional regulator of competence genes